MTPLVEILLSTLNGARHLPDLLRSLRRQTVGSFRVLARDDGSTDGTRELLRAEATGRELELRILEVADGRSGPAGSFGRLLEASTAPRVMFCDQDDVWDADKVEVALAAMEAAEARAGPGVPVLVHTDLRVVDGELRELHPSFWRLSRLDPRLTMRFSRTVVQNGVVGCTVMVNRPLAERARPIPTEALMHDHWLALVASAFGSVKPVTRATVSYRRHGANETPLPERSARRLARMAVGGGGRTGLREGLTAARAQAGAFRARYAAELPVPLLATLDDFLRMDEAGPLERRRILLRHGLLKHGWLRNVGLLARV